MDDGSITMEPRHRLKYSKNLDDPMTLKEMEIWHSQEVEISRHPTTFGRTGKTLKETAKELHVDTHRITRTKKKSDYNAATKAMFEQRCGGAVQRYVDNILKLTEATKSVNVRVQASEGSAAMVIKRVEEPENTVRFNATCKIGDALGVDAPKQVDLTHTLGAMSDQELKDVFDNSIKDIDEHGHTQRKITSTSNAGTIVTGTVITGQSAMVGGGGEPTARPTTP